ncbi:sensor histidine kinase [Spirosoma harenae]
MKSLLMRLLVSLLPLHQLAAQSSSPTTFQRLEREIASLSDSARFERLAAFYQNKLNPNQFTQAASAIAEMGRIADRLQNQTLRGRTFMAKGYFEQALNNSTQAVLNFQKASISFNAPANVSRKIRALQRIAGVYIELKDLEMAQHYSERGLEIARRANRKTEIANVYTDLATIEDIRQHPAKALEYNGQAIAIYKLVGGDYLYTLFNRAIILKNAGQYEESTATYRQCMKQAVAQHDSLLLGMIYLNLPNTLLKMNQLDEAEQYIRLAEKWSRQQSENLLHLRSIYETLTAIAEKRGHYQQALAYHKQWATYRDSLFNSEKSRQLIETETRFQTREKQLQIQLLNQDNLRQQQQVGWLIGGVSLLVILLGLMVWQYRVLRRTNRELDETNHTLSVANERIHQQTGQLKELMRELHHRVKNNLAIVSSLLYLQSNRLEDEKAIQAVREGQQRVEAMSLIHQQLYQTDNVTRVSLPAYIGDLVRGLMQSFRHQDNFDLQLHIEPIDVDVELAVPLGLILNELTTNAFKHAYHGVVDPRLSIRLWESDQLYLEISDNGSGIDPIQWQKPSRSFGKRLINSLVKQAKGQLTIDNRYGTCFQLILPRTKKTVPTHKLSISEPVTA